MEQIPKEFVGEDNLLSKEQPLFTSSMMLARDDEMDNLNVHVSYPAPSHSDKYSTFMRFFEAMVGQYNERHNGKAHLNASNRQYHRLHAHLGDCPGINLQKCEYHSYSDFGLFTNYFHGHEIWTREMIQGFQSVIGQWAKYMAQHEVFRTRNALFNQLLNWAPSHSLNGQIARDVFYLGRRVNRTELAMRYSALTSRKTVSDLLYHLFINREISYSLWGNGHQAINFVNFDDYTLKSTNGNPAGFIKLY